MYRYYTNGVCAKSILLDIQGDKLIDVVFEGGCAGNLIGIKTLIEGKSIDEIIEILNNNSLNDLEDLELANEVILNYIDKNVRRVTDDETVGLIICKKENKLILEYCSEPRIFETTYLLKTL